MLLNRVNFLRGTVFPQTFSFFMRYEKNQKYKKKQFCFSGKSDVTFIINFQLKFSF